jgi:hypothetical protein
MLSTLREINDCAGCKNNEEILMSQNLTPSFGVDRVLQRLCDASATIGGIVLSLIHI